MNKYRWIGFWMGLILAGMTYFLLPPTFASEGRATAALAVWMAIWWMTEAIPIPATALLPLIVLPLAGASSIRKAASPYGHELIFLFMGGFILALSMQKWNLHKRISFFALRLVGSKPSSIVGGFMIITAIMSMWVSNTATTIMMLPVALSVINVFQKYNHDDSFAVCLLLGIAYAASIGGIGTLIGTPPNLFLASFVKNQLGTEIGFLKWMTVGIPLVIIFLPLVWLILTRALFPLPKNPIHEAADVTKKEYEKLGRMSRGEKVTFVVFLLTAALWITRPLLEKLTFLSGLTDPGIAIFSAMLLFIIPVNVTNREFTMDWDTARELPWGLLILFGGGLSLASAIETTGVGELIANQVSSFQNWPPILISFAVAIILVYLTELTSNTATAATLIPILSSLAIGFNIHPYHLIIPAAIGASCAFMLPVATPPNAIIFGSGHVTIPQMVQAGFWLNIIGVILITLLTYAVAIPLLL